MTEELAHRAYAHATVHQLRRGRVPKLVDLAFDLCLITQLCPLMECGPITHALIFVFSRPEERSRGYISGAKIRAHKEARLDIFSYEIKLAGSSTNHFCQRH